VQRAVEPAIARREESSFSIAALLAASK